MISDASSKPEKTAAENAHRDIAAKALEPLVRAVIHQIGVIAAEMPTASARAQIYEVLSQMPVDLIAQRTQRELTFEGAGQSGRKRDKSIATIDFDSLFESVCAAATFARQDSVAIGLQPAGRPDQ